MAIDASSVKIVKAVEYPEELLEFGKLIQKFNKDFDCDPARLLRQGVVFPTNSIEKLIFNCRIRGHVVIDPDKYKQADGSTTVVHGENPKVGISIWNDPFYKNGCTVTTWMAFEEEGKLESTSSIPPTRLNLLGYLYPLQSYYAQASAIWQRLIDKEQLNPNIDYALVKREIVPHYFIGAGWKHSLSAIAIDMAAHDLPYNFQNDWRTNLTDHIREEKGECNEQEVHRIVDGLKQVKPTNTAPLKIKIRITEFVLPEICHEDERTIYDLGLVHDDSIRCLAYGTEIVSHSFYPTTSSVDQQKLKQVAANLKGRGLIVSVKKNGMTVTHSAPKGNLESLSGKKKEKKLTDTQIGFFYNMYKKPLNYLFRLLKAKRKSKEQKETIQSLLKEMRKVEKAFQKNHDLADSIVNLLLDQRKLKLGKLEASFTPSLSAAVALTESPLGLFYTINRKPLNYLFALLRLPRKRQEQKDTIMELIKTLKRKEKKFMKERDISTPILDKLISQRKLKIPEPK